MMTSISTNGENFFIWKMYNGQPEKKPKEFNIKEFLGLLVEELTIFVTGQNNEWSSETKLKTALGDYPCVIKLFFDLCKKIKKIEKFLIKVGF